MKNNIITIDGPAGSGKGRIAKYISRRWGYYHLDSGILYRRIAHLLLINNIENTNKLKIANFLSNYKNLPHKSHSVLRSEKISILSSKIAVYEIVREFVNKHQRKIVNNKIKKMGFVIDGRDIGSVVFKKAKIKIYIDVNPKIRAERRHKQLIDIGEKSIYQKILEEIKLRDKKDKLRKISPLVIPNGAYIIDNSKSFKKTSEQINRIIKNIK